MSQPIFHLPDSKRVNIFRWSQMYFGDPTTEELWRPNVSDLVIKDDVGIYLVKSVDDNSVPTLELVLPWANQSQFRKDSTSLIAGLSNYQPSAANPIYIDRTHNPAIMTVDGHYTMSGSEPVYMVFYRGTDTSAKGEIISEMRNAGNVLIDNKVPLVNADTEGVTKRPQQFRTSKTLDAGETITGVAFTSTGGEYRRQPFLLMESSVLRPLNPDNRYVTDISLKGDIIDADDPLLINNNVGTPITTAMLTAVLHYNDGHTVDIAIDGTKCVLMGLDKFNTGTVGRPYKLTVAYYPSPDEPYIGKSDGAKPVIPKTYKLANITQVNSHNLKVYIIPHWHSDTNKYTFNYRLCNLAGDVEHDVTDEIVAKIQESNEPVNGGLFATEQDILLSLNMNTISEAVYKGYIHTQTLDVTLHEPGDASGQTWIIDYIRDDTNPFGVNVDASVNAAGNSMNLLNGATDVDSWLGKLYYTVEPLFDNEAGSKAAKPTHFIIEYEGKVTDKIAVSSYNTNITKPSGMDNWVLGKTAIIKWIEVVGGADKVRGITPLYIKADL